MTAGERTALYRIYGEADVLLYIGITNCIPVRWNGHQAVQPWWDEIRSLAIDWRESRQEAAEAERAAIQAEQPKYNVTYLKPSLISRERKRSEIMPVNYDAVEIAPRDDDEDLLNLDDIARMLRMTSSTGAFNALKHTAGPKGFKVGTQQLFRRREIRKWIAAIEAAQAVRTPEADPARAGVS